MIALNTVLWLIGLFCMFVYHHSSFTIVVTPLGITVFSNIGSVLDYS